MPRANVRVRGGASAGVLLACLASTWSRDAAALDPDKRISQYVAATWKQTEDGLPQNMVSAMAQTPDGYLWLASQEGLVRFDGVRFSVFDMRNTPALASADIAVLTADHAGVLWVGTRGGGLVRYEAGAFTRVGAGQVNEFVSALFEDREHRLWIGTRQGVTVLENGAFTTYGTKDGLPGDVGWAFAEGGDGALWIGTDAGLARWKDGRFTTLSTADGLSHAVVPALMFDHEGTLWIGTKGGGVDTLRDGKFDLVAGKDRLGDDTVTALLEDRDRNVWIGTAGGGIHRMTHGQLTGFLQKGGDHFDSVRTFFEDRERNLWVGLEGAGLLRLKDGKVTTFGVDEGLPGDEIWSVRGGDADDLWLGTKRGLAHYAGGTFTNYASKDGLPNEVVFAIETARAGGVWLGTDGGGMSRYKDGKFTTIDKKSGLSSDTIWSLHEDAAGALWIGTFPQGLVRMQDGKFTTFGVKDGLPPNGVLQMAESPDGTLWIGTSGGGLVARKDGAFKVWGTKEGLLSDIVETIYVDEDGAIWAGTSGGGLARLKDGKIASITAKEGLYDDTVLQIVDDLAGDFWMTSNKGIFRAKRADLVDVLEKRRPQVRCTSYGIMECNGGGPGGWRGSDGKLWFATVRGAAMVDPKHMPTNTLAPPVLIEQIEVDHQVRDLAASHDLAAGSRDFTFAYTALSFTTPEKVRFKYRLEGFDRDWVDAASRRVAYYTNLAPGAYRFRVIAANDDGVWNEDGASASFYLTPHIYQTTPFYIALGLGVLLLGAGTAGLRVRQLRAIARELERKVERRTKQLAKANGELKVAFSSLEEKDARLHEDLLQAQAFQQRILPKLPGGDRVQWSALYKPADMVGGDIYDVCELARSPEGHRRFRVFVADTTGHGVQASLRTMVLKTEYDRIKLTHARPGEVLTELNRKIAGVYPGLEMRCSACCFDVETREDGTTVVHYANAAHPPLLHVSGGKVDEIHASGTFIGMVDEAAFRETKLEMRVGDLLLAYTDGVCEQENRSGTAFGIERMEELLSRGKLHAADVVRTLDAEVGTFADGRALDDDMLLVCIECMGNGGEPAGVQP